MSSTIEVQRICQHCGKLFTAHTTVTKYCSQQCSKRAYKARKRAEKTEEANQQTRRTISKPFEELRSKPYLSISEACQLMGVSRRTIYRMIGQSKLKVAKIGARTILRRKDFDNLFELPLPVRPKRENKPVEEFYTVKDIEELYFIKYRRLNTILKENHIPRTMKNGKLFISKPHIDRYFKRKRDDVSTITEWYTVADIQKKYDLSRDQIYNRTHDYNIPKQRVGKYVKISKKHFDELF